MGLVRITSWYPEFNGSHFGLPQLYPKNDLTGRQNGVNYDVFAQATFTDCIFTPLELIEQCTQACEKNFHCIVVKNMQCT